MKQSLFTLLFSVILISVFSPSFGFAESRLFSQPKRLLLYDDSPKETNENPYLLKSYFYPLGWSKDGKFAYYVEPPDEACGCYFAEIFIADLKTDKILWSKKYNSELSKINTLAKYWKQNRKVFSRKLNQYGIRQFYNFPLLKPQFTRKNDTYKVNFFSDAEVNDDDGYSSKGKIEIKLFSAKKGEKIIHQKFFEGQNFAGILGSKLGGILLSPFEDRIAVIRVDTQRGWEGPPHVTKISVIGADLNRGFNR